MTQANRHRAGSVIAGQKRGGQFKTRDRSARTAPPIATLSPLDTLKDRALDRYERYGGRRDEGVTKLAEALQNHAGGNLQYVLEVENFATERTAAIIAREAARVEHAENMDDLSDRYAQSRGVDVSQARRRLDEVLEVHGDSDQLAAELNEHGFASPARAEDFVRTAHYAQVFERSE